MSRLDPGLIVLDKGLNLQTPKITAPEGSVLDTINYEQVDFQGQKRIEGYARYDGSLGSYIDDYFLVTIGENEVVAGEVVFGENGRAIGVAVGVREAELAIAIIDHTFVFEDGQSLLIGPDSTAYDTSPVGWGNSVDNVTEHYTNLLVYNQVLRELVEGLPGPVAALHWFRDRLYAVAGVMTFAIAPIEELHINDALNIGSSFATVLAITGSFISVGTNDVAIWAQVGEDVSRDGDVVGVTLGIVSSPVASFFESRTELQVLDEDADLIDRGWRFVHQGWLVGFENGLSLYGSLPSLNQNIQGLGVQGPTSTAGNTGRPLLLTQGITISGEKAQVNGWKSSQTPTSYTLNPSDVWEDDAVYAYADAYISWNGTSGQVTAPGITTPNLEQNSANNTVVVEGV